MSDTSAAPRTQYKRLLIVDVEAWGKDAGKPKRLSIRAVDEAGNRCDWTCFAEAASDLVKTAHVGQGFGYLVAALLKPDLFAEAKAVLASGDKAKMTAFLTSKVLPLGRNTAEDLLTGDQAQADKRVADLKPKLVGNVVLVNQYSRGMSEPDEKGRVFENFAVANYDTRKPDRLPNPFVSIMPNVGGNKPEMFGAHNREEYVSTGAWKGMTAEMIAKESVDALSNPSAFIATPTPRKQQAAKQTANTNEPVADEVPLA